MSAELDAVACGQPSLSAINDSGWRSLSALSGSWQWSPLLLAALSLPSTSAEPWLGQPPRLRGEMVRPPPLHASLARSSARGLSSSP